MRTLLLVLALSTACHGAYGHHRSITLHAASVPSNQTNFTVLVSGTYSYLATIANGGEIQNTVAFNGQTVPADMKITSDAGGTALLNWDVGSYTATNGTIEIWVKIPTLSSSANTLIYIWSGDASVTTYQGGAVGAAWDSSFVAVYHLANGTTLSALDSSASGTTLTNNNTATPTAGKVDGGVNFAAASSQYLSLAASATLKTIARTASAWIKPASFPGAYNTVLGMDDTSNDYFDIHVKSNGKIALYMGTPTVMVSYDGTGATTLSTGIWYHVAMTYSNAAGLVGYVNGSSDGTFAGGGGDIATFANPILNIGNNQPNFGTRLFDGVIDEVRVSSVARSADWIAIGYTNQNNPAAFYDISADLGPAAGGARRRQVVVIQ